MFLAGVDGWLGIERDTFESCPAVGGCAVRIVGPVTGSGGILTVPRFMATEVEVPAVPSLVFGSFEFLPFFPKQRQLMASVFVCVLLVVDFC